MKSIIKQEYSLYDLLSLFLIYSFIGWCLETIYAFFRHGYYVNRGFLLGPLCPIYGFGVVIMILLLEPVKDNILLFFLSSTALMSSLEYLTGAAMLKVFNARWWDYREMQYNVDGFITLETSLLWGLLSILLIHSLHPYVVNLLRKASTSFYRRAALGLCMLTLCDFVFSVILSI